jgi:hypothetical protein
MSGCIGNGHGINAWETQEPEEIVGGRNHIARLLKQAEEGAFECDLGCYDEVILEEPIMPYSRYKNSPVSLVPLGFIIEEYKTGALHDYPEIKDWVEDQFHPLALI